MDEHRKEQYRRARIAALVAIGLLVLGAAAIGASAGYRHVAGELAQLSARTEQNAEDIMALRSFLASSTETSEELAAALETKLKQLASIARESDKEQQQLRTHLQTLETELVEQRTRTQRPDIAELVTRWGPRVAQIECTFAFDDDVTSVASAVATHLDGTPTFMTSKHVLNARGRGDPKECVVRLLEQGIGFVVNGDAAVLSEKRDIGYVPITGIEQLPAALMNEAPLCDAAPQIGEPVLILGYPNVGATSGITATDGIISGIEDDYYVTSAKIEQGNSGGAAINLKRDCLLGIPTLVLAGKVESLARILPLQ